MMLMNMKKQLDTFVKLQTRLVGALKIQYPEVSDWEWLLDLPKRGILICNDEEWEFRQHGRGVCFQQRNGRGIVIDVHRGLNHPDTFDTWRLLQYFEALGGPDEEEFWEKQLQELMAAGVVSEQGEPPKLYTLRESRWKTVKEKSIKNSVSDSGKVALVRFRPHRSFRPTKS
jgi:hypothetical protein